jgi:integrase
MLRSARPPSWRHKARGCAVVTIHGTNHYLGPYGSPQSHEKYARLITQHFSGNGAGTPAIACAANPTINDVLLACWDQEVEVHHRKDGRPTDWFYQIRVSLRPLRKLYGSTLASDFGPKSLQLVREEIIRDGLARRGGVGRGYVNEQIAVIRRMFRWAVAQEPVPVTVYQALVTVVNIPKGRDPRVKESTKIRPAPEEHVQAVLAVAPAHLATMIQVQRLTGMRPDEVTIMRPWDIVQEGEVWTYRPHAYKTEHLDIERVIPLGPKAQALLKPWLNRDPEAYLFSPREAVEAARARRARNERRPGRRPKQRPAQHLREHYSDESYCQAVERLCAKAGLPKWTPNQLRHGAATAIREKYGIEAARLILGHTSVSTTAIYAEKNMTEARRIMKEIG